jgi:hypothetical protein
VIARVLGEKRALLPIQTTNKNRQLRFFPDVLFEINRPKLKKLRILFLTRLKTTPLLLSMKTSLIVQIPLETMVRHSQVLLLFLDDSQSIAVLLLAIRNPRKLVP